MDGPCSSVPKIYIRRFEVHLNPLRFVVLRDLCHCLALIRPRASQVKEHLILNYGRWYSGLPLPK